MPHLLGLIYCILYYHPPFFLFNLFDCLLLSWVNTENNITLFAQKDDIECVMRIFYLQSNLMTASQILVLRMLYDLRELGEMNLLT